MEPRGKRGQGGLHALDEVRKVEFDVGYEDLGVVSVLGHMSVRCVQAEVVGEDGEQHGTKGGSLEDTHGIRKRFRNRSVAGRGGDADRLRVTREVRGKPGRVDTVKLEFGNEQRVTSKHLLRSRRHKRETCSRSMLEKMWLVTESRAVSVE